MFHPSNEKKLIDLSKLYPKENKYTGHYSLDLIDSGLSFLCIKWRNYVITGYETEIKVFDMNNSLSSPIQTLTLAHRNISDWGAYLIVDDSTLYIGSQGGIYMMKM